ncbi:MAG: division/cell wall cluster transcriptional repressor MraZ [Burkholderiales bacterium]|nr:division/cell wall cluster transcriptional repressor MraZ [Burkholderiales bacterium]
MFSGVTNLNLDSKNRIAIPAKYRDVLQEEFSGRLVVTLESAKCLLIYTEEAWNVVRDKIQNLPNSVHPLVKSYQRLVLGHAENLEIDKAGRILLPATLRSMVGLDHELSLVGMGDKFELWNKAKWDAETNQALSASAEDLALLLNGLSI